MTMKQCVTCKWHTYELRHNYPHEGCYLIGNPFMSSKNCRWYKQGELNQGKKEFYEELGKKPPYKFLK